MCNVLPEHLLLTSRSYSRLRQKLKPLLHPLGLLVAPPFHLLPSFILTIYFAFGTGYISPLPPSSWPSTRGSFLPPCISIHLGHPFRLWQNTLSPPFLHSRPILSMEISFESEGLCMAILHPNFRNCCLEPVKFEILLTVMGGSSNHTSSVVCVKHSQAPSHRASFSHVSL